MEVGEPVAMRFSKWDGTPHWRMDGTYLGADEFGHWMGARPPVQLSRPGRDFVDPRHIVGLFPHDGWFSAAFHEQLVPELADPEVPMHIEVWVDITTVPRWEHTPTGLTVHAVDLDLDVFRTWIGEVVVDDEDEFAEHRVTLGYPDDVVRGAERSCAEVAAAVRARREPFGTTAAAWLAVLTA